MPEVKWAGPAFRRLAALPQDVAFQIIARVDQLEKFPQMGRGLRSRDDEYRVLIVRQRFRIAYRYDKARNTVLVLALQRTLEPQLPLATLYQIEEAEEEG